MDCSIQSMMQSTKNKNFSLKKTNKQEQIHNKDSIDHNDHLLLRIMIVIVFFSLILLYKDVTVRDSHSHIHHKYVRQVDCSDLTSGWK